MKSKAIFATLAIAVVLAMTITVAYANNAPFVVGSIMCTDSAGITAYASYSPADDVFIKVLAIYPPLAKVDIIIKTPDGTPVTGTFLNNGVGDLINVGKFLPGDYIVWVAGSPLGTFTAGGSFHVIPESMFGALTATIAGIGAFATIGIVKRKQTKSK